ncbi:unnamed protein product [Mortierella alpina]
MVTGSCIGHNGSSEAAGSSGDHTNKGLLCTSQSSVQSSSPHQDAGPLSSPQNHDSCAVAISAPLISSPTENSGGHGAMIQLRRRGGRRQAAAGAEQTSSNTPNLDSPSKCLSPWPSATKTLSSDLASPSEPVQEGGPNRGPRLVIRLPAVASLSAQSSTSTSSSPSSSPPLAAKKRTRRVSSKSVSPTPMRGRATRTSTSLEQDPVDTITPVGHDESVSPDKAAEKVFRGNKRPKVQDHKNGHQSLTSIAPRLSLVRESDRMAMVPKGLVSVTGDEYALKHNNDYCETCLGLGQFICCDTCPKAFHFSCCNPPMDPANLPDEWNCNECRARLNPPMTNPEGIFKNLLDHIDGMNPRSFELPEEIRSYFKGVETNSDGGYVDTQDYKPTLKNTPTTSSSSHTSLASEESLQMLDRYGRTRYCFQCNRSAFGGRMMISCDHCPLHWHLDCLNPPMASPPPRNRRWMCPNHVDPVMPKRRKKRDAVAIDVSDPFAFNDGDIEIMDDATELHAVYPFTSRFTQRIGGGIYRVPEAMILRGFVKRCQR